MISKWDSKWFSEFLDRVAIDMFNSWLGTDIKPWSKMTLKEKRAWRKFVGNFKWPDEEGEGQ